MDGGRQSEEIPLFVLSDYSVYMCCMCVDIKRRKGTFLRATCSDTMDP